MSYGQRGLYLLIISAFMVICFPDGIFLVIAKPDDIITEASCFNNLLGST